MPPKQKFTKTEIINASLIITRRDGFNSITARGIGAELGSSSRPIFTVFKNMSEVLDETICMAKKYYNEYVAIGMSESISFKGVGMAYVKFAQDEPQLFQLLFMTERQSLLNLANVLSIIDENSSQILDAIISEYGLSVDHGRKLYQHLWIYTHGIATLCATKVCNFSTIEIDEMLTQVFKSILINMKANENL